MSKVRSEYVDGLGEGMGLSAVKVVVQLKLIGAHL